MGTLTIAEWIFFLIESLDCRVNIIFDILHHRNKVDEHFSSLILDQFKPLRNHILGDLEVLESSLLDHQVSVAQFSQFFLEFLILERVPILLLEGISSLADILPSGFDILDSSIARGESRLPGSECLHLHPVLGHCGQ